MKKGFTLIELLVVITIAGIFTTAAIFGTVHSKRISALNRAAKMVILSLRDVQNKSLITKEGASGVVPCGFGIHYNNDTSFIVFSEETSPSGGICVASTTATLTQNIDRLYQAPNGYGTDIALKTFTLREGNYVKFASSFPDIYFEPPDGLTYINGEHDNTVAPSVDITVCLRDDCAQHYKTIRVYLGGNIEVVD